MLQAEVHYEKNESFVDLKTLITPVFSIFHPVWTPHIQSNYHQQRTSQILKIWYTEKYHKHNSHWSVLLKYGVSLPIQCKCGKIRTRKTPNTDTFHALIIFKFSRHCYIITLEQRYFKVILMFSLFFTRKIIIMSSWRVLEIYDNFLKGYL